MIIYCNYIILSSMQLIIRNNRISDVMILRIVIGTIEINYGDLSPLRIME